MFDPIEINLDKPRRFKLTPKALKRAEDKINQLRGVNPHQRMAIDYLIYAARRDSIMGVGSCPRDLAVVLVWSGLFDWWAKKQDGEIDLTVEVVEDLVYETSPLTAGQILDLVFDHYAEVVNKKKSEPDKAEKPEVPDPLASRPGSNSPPLQ